MFEPCVSVCIYETTVDTWIRLLQFRVLQVYLALVGRSSVVQIGRAISILYGHAEASKTANGVAGWGWCSHLHGAHTVLCVPYIIYCIRLHRGGVLSCSPRDISQHARGAVHRSLPVDLCRSASVSSSAWPRHCYFTVRSLSPRLHHRPQTHTISRQCYYCHYRPIIHYHIGIGNASRNTFPWKNISI